MSKPKAKKAKKDGADADGDGPSTSKKKKWLTYVGPSFNLSYLRYLLLLYLFCSMAVKQWKVLSWSVRGINSDKKWNSIKDHISKNNCDAVCLQETKRNHFDIPFLGNFYNS
jgi:hypothetical protein